MSIATQFHRSKAGQHKTPGFTLLELMIVIALIAIIASIALPNLLRSRMTANEAQALGCMRTLSTAESQFQMATFVDADGDGHGDYATLVQLGNPDGTGATPPFIDNVLAAGVKGGYVFTVTVRLGDAATTPGYTALGEPVTSGKTGYRRFFVNESGVIRFTADGTVPTAASTPLS